MSTNRKSMMADSRHGGATPRARCAEIVRGAEIASKDGTEGSYPTAGEVFGEIGVTFMAFLAIALLANILAALLAA